MKGLNKVTMIGNLGRDPEIITLAEGRKVAHFALATNETYRDKQGKPVVNTDWHSIVAWSPLADVAENYLRKGSHLYIEGKLKNRKYTNKEGQTCYVTEIIADQFLMLDKPETGKGKKEVKPSPKNDYPFGKSEEKVLN